MIRKSCLAAAAIGTFAALVLFHTTTAWAKPTGYNVVCHNCHDQGMVPTVTLSANPPTVQPGGTTTLTITTTRTNGNGAGFFITTEGRGGTFALVDTVGTRLIPMDAEGPAGVTHTRPKLSTTGNNSFQVRWTAPTTPGAVDFDVYSVSATGKIDPATMKVFPEDDGMGHARLSMSFGCAGVKYWPDEDGDGYGATFLLGPTTLCQPMKNFAVTSDDCNDVDPMIHPKGVEICNKIDDNCDGKTDENLPPVPLYPDTDGDGFGVSEGVMMGACGAVNGYSPKNGDCNDKDAKVNPSAKETCNNVDDDCNGKIDNGVLPTCGVGWCARTSSGCNPALCTPGNPRAEVCNGLDDDCNGAIDEGTSLCPAGQTCQGAECKPGGGPAGTGGTPATTGQGGSAPGNPSVGATGCDMGGALSSGGAAAGLLLVSVMASGLLKRRRRR